MRKQAWMQAALDAGFEQFEIYEQRNTSTSIQVYEQKVDSFQISDCDGIAMRGLYKGKMGDCFLEEISDDDMSLVLEQIKENASIITKEDKVEIQSPAAQYPSVKRRKNKLLETEHQEKIQVLKQLEKTLLEMDDRIKQVMDIHYDESIGMRSIMNTKGMNVQDTDSNAYLGVTVLARDGEDTRDGYDWMLIKDLQDLDVDAFARNLCDQVCAKLHARSITSGRYPVLMKREAMTDLFSALCRLFDGENAYKGISILKDRLNETIFDEKISVQDDPLMDDGCNTVPFDDEGIACYAKKVVDKGVLKTYLHNTTSAELMHTVSTGNGFKGSYSSTVGIMPTNFYIENGDHAYDDMIRSMDKGIIVTSLSGLHAGLNPVSTEFSLQSEGFYVENGKIAYPINLFTIAGNFMDMMKHIQMIGNDLKMGSSGVGTPSIVFDSISISGE